ncbi:MAG: hypothetical protein OXK76_18660 [Gammaproteobacteria bacterium]|nr:hypothetical protein [Gammaproteobacteria bacterium]
MKKQIWALVAVLVLGGFASASAGVSTASMPQTNVVHWATVVFCERYEDGRSVNDVCVGGHTGHIVRDWLDISLSAFPTRSGTFLSH